MSDVKIDAIPCGRVLVLEDESGPLDQIRELLSQCSDVEATYVRDIPKYVERLNTAPFDAVSIDWQIGEIFGGVNALIATKELQPRPAAVVYSRFPDQKHRALSLGADVFIPKARPSEYPIAMIAAVRIGLARRIRRSLTMLGLSLAVAAPLTFPLDNATEAALFSASREEMRTQLLRQKVSIELRDALIRRRWWTAFDDGLFAQLSWPEKLRLLLRYAGVNDEDISAILGAPCAVLDTAVVDTHALPKAVEHSLRDLTSLCTFVLRLSAYEPELMRHYWTVAGMAAPGQSGPPWDSVGLGTYLKTGGLAALGNSLTWIRNIR